MLCMVVGGGGRGGSSGGYVSKDWGVGRCGRFNTACVW